MFSFTVDTLDIIDHVSIKLEMSLVGSSCLYNPLEQQFDYGHKSGYHEKQQQQVEYVPQPPLSVMEYWCNKPSEWGGGGVGCHWYVGDSAGDILGAARGKGIDNGWILGVGAGCIVSMRVMDGWYCLSIVIKFL
jgi:hypothetical protein